MHTKTLNNRVVWSILPIYEDGDLFGSTERHSTRASAYKSARTFIECGIAAAVLVERTDRFGTVTYTAFGDRDLLVDNGWIAPSVKMTA